MMERLNVICSLFVTSLLVALCSPYDNLGCDNISDLQEVINTDELELDFNGIIKTFEDVNISSIISTINNKFEKLYVDARLEEDENQTNLIIFTTNNFGQYIREQTSTKILVTIHFACPQGTIRTLVFVQPIQEGNFYTPEFYKDSYVIVVPTPLFKGFELTVFENINVTDYDLIGNDITFSSTGLKEINILFGVREKRGKTSLASLKLESSLTSLTKNIQFFISATDNGNPPRSSNPKKVTITLDTSKSIPPVPRFTEAVVYGILTEELKLNELELVLYPETYTEDVSFKKFRDEDNIFKISNNGNIVHVSLSKQLDSEFFKDKDMLTLTVEASNSKLKESGKTAVSVLRPKKQEYRFEEGLYKGKLIAKTNELDIDNFEICTNTNDLDEINFQLEGEYKEAFTIYQHSDIVTLSLKRNLNANLFTNIMYVSLKLTAQIYSEEIATTNIIIDIVHTKLWFEKSTYFGWIDSDNTLNMESVKLITNGVTTNDVKIQLLQESADLFIFDKIENEIMLNLKDNIENQLENKTLFRLEIMAEEKMTGVKAACALLIGRTIKKKDYSFKEILYKGKLIAKTNILDIDDFEMLANTDDFNEMHFELEGEFKEAFTIYQHGDIVTLSLKRNSNVNTWTNITYVSFKLTAQILSKEIATTNIIIDVVHTKLWFEKYSYYGLIDSDDHLNMESIKLYSSGVTTNDVKIHLLQDSADLFIFDKIENEIQLKLKDDIETDFAKKKMFQLEIVAEESVTGVKTICAVLVESIIVEKVYHFKEGLYKGKLVLKKNILDIDEIELSTNNVGLGDMDIELEGEFKETFSIERYENIVTLSLKSNLIPNMWANITYLSLILIAHIDLETNPSTNIIIEVVHMKLWFDKPAYIGSISSDEILLIESINIYTTEAETNGVEIQLLQADANLFSFDKFGSEIKLKLKENMKTDLGNKTLFQLEIAVEENTTGAKAICAVLFRRSIDKKVYRFKEGVYKGKITAKTNILDIDEFEILTNIEDLDEMSVELEGEFNDTFTLNWQENIVTLSLKRNSNTNTWTNITYVSFKLTAQVHSENIATTNIIIDVVHTKLWFNKSAYFGSINMDEVLAMESIKVFSNEAITNDVEIKLRQKDTGLFSFNKTGDEIILYLKEKIAKRLEHKSLFQLEIVAADKTTGITAVCIVLIERYIKEKEFRFKEALYKAKLNAKTNYLDVNNFEIFTNTDDLDEIHFEIEGQFRNSFESNRFKNIINLTLKSDLSKNVWKNITYIILRLTAKKDLKEIASTTIAIDVIHTILWFDKTIYFGSISSYDYLVLDPLKLYSNNNVTEDDISILLLQSDADLFLFDKIGNEINLKLKENIQSVLQNKTKFRLEIIAEERETGVKAVCVVLIEKTVDGKVMKFSQNFYESEINADYLFAFDLDLERESYTEDTIISISGPYATLFKINQNENKMSLSLNDTFNITDYHNVSYLWLEVKASSLMKKLEAWSIVVFNLIQEIRPEFEDQVYIGAITKLNKFEIPKISIRRSTWKNSTFVEIIGNYSEYFGSNLTENELNISLISEIPDDVKVGNTIVLLIFASNGYSKGFTTLIVNLPTSRTLSNLFKKIIQSGKITQNETVQELEMPDIELVNQYNVPDFNCKLIGDEVIYFDYSVISPKNVIKLSLSSKIPEEIIHKSLYIMISLECENKDNYLKAGSTVLFLTLPGTNGCPTPEPPTYVPEFLKPFYNFYAKPSFVGSLQKVRAIIRDSDDTIRYFLDIRNEHLNSKLDIEEKSGELLITAIISAGTYFFKIFAENVVTRSLSKVDCRLDIEPLIQCDDHPVVSNSLLIKHFKEETEYDNIFNTSIGDCNFKVFAITPGNQEYVYIDPVSKALRLISIDRETPIFANMIAPQIKVKLKLYCDIHNNSITKRYIKRSKRDFSYPISIVENRLLPFIDDIIFAKDVTILSIILTDINDNYPEFVYPKHKRLVVGFPRDENLMDLYSDCIIQVFATDKDEGLNKKIRYSIQPNIHFQIDSTTGKVYPRANAMFGVHEVDIIIYATDRDGESDGLSTNFTLTVKVLTADHFSLLTFENEHIQSVDTLMKSAINKTGLSLILVRHAIVNLVNESSSVLQRISNIKSHKFISKLWVYAFEEDIPVSSKIIEELLVIDGDQSMNISAQSVKDVYGIEEVIIRNCSHDVSGYIYGLATLSVTVIICIGFIVWKYIRSSLKRVNDETVCNSTSHGRTKPNFDIKKGSEINIKNEAHILSDIIHEPSYYASKESTKKLGLSSRLTTDDYIMNYNQPVNGSVHEMSYDTESESSTSSSNESLRPRATVTFNELVQRIHIDDNSKMKF